MKTKIDKKASKQTVKKSGKDISGATTPSTENNAAEQTSAPAKNGSYSPLKLVLIEKSIERGEEVHAKMVSDGCFVSYPTVLDLVHGVKKRYGKRTLMAVATWLNVPVERITP